jgi:hypothetical protein
MAKTQLQEGLFGVLRRIRLPIEFASSTYEGAIKYSFDVKGLLVESKHNISPRRFANPRRIGKYESRRLLAIPFLS